MKNHKPMTHKIIQSSKNPMEAVENKVKNNSTLANNSLKTNKK